MQSIAPVRDSFIVKSGRIHMVDPSIRFVRKKEDRERDDFAVWDLPAEDGIWRIVCQPAEESGHCSGGVNIRRTFIFCEGVSDGNHLRPTNNSGGEHTSMTTSETTAGEDFTVKVISKMLGVFDAGFFEKSEVDSVYKDCLATEGTFGILRNSGCFCRCRFGEHQVNVTMRGGRCVSACIAFVE
ncbi:MAG: hypothetical protein EHM36_10980 [Deltaproteobacteria bacterium]|nr:MAG: hypothetical protein EHM36_10980 [Deltaproteobacteria bacterium]